MPLPKKWCLTVIKFQMRYFLPYSAASFSVPLTTSVIENKTVIMCVTMTATPENATLAKEVVVNLSTMDGSGKLTNDQFEIIVNKFTTATNIDGDFPSVFTLLTFGLGSTDGADMCTSLTANADYLVEYEEDFALMLNLETAGASLSLGNGVTTITIIDGDGM